MIVWVSVPDTDMWNTCLFVVQKTRIGLVLLAAVKLPDLRRPNWRGGCTCTSGGAWMTPSLLLAGSVAAVLIGLQDDFRCILWHHNQNTRDDRMVWVTTAANLLFILLTSRSPSCFWYNRGLQTTYTIEMLAFTFISLHKLPRSAAFPACINYARSGSLLPATVFIPGKPGIRSEALNNY